MKPVYLEAVGCAAPGMPSWQTARAVFGSNVPYLPAPLPPHLPELLPPNERRRTTPAVRLAFQAAEDAMRASSVPAANVATVFASSDAELSIIHRISSALTATPPLISPTDFHNSVHNAAAGYWHIATSAHAASSTVCAFDGTFAAGLFESCTQVVIDARDTLLVAFDLPAPQPLDAKRPMTHAAAVALLLTRTRTERTLAALDCSIAQNVDETALTDPALEALRIGNPASRALPLLREIALRVDGCVSLPMANGNFLLVELTQ